MSRRKSVSIQLHTVLSVFFCSLFILVIHDAPAQSLGNIMPGYQSTVSGALSYGGSFDGKGWYWGASADYTRLVRERWILSGSLAYDEETTTLGNDNFALSKTISLQFAAGYTISKRFVLGGGFAKGFAASEALEDWRYKDFGDDWTVGLISSYTFWLYGPHGVDIGGSIEYRINEVRLGYSLEMGYGYSF